MPFQHLKEAYKKGERGFWKGHIVSDRTSGWSFLGAQEPGHVLASFWAQHCSWAGFSSTRKGKEQDICPKRCNALVIALVTSSISCLIPSSSSSVGISQHFAGKCFMHNGYYFSSWFCVCLESSLNLPTFHILWVTLSCLVLVQRDKCTMIIQVCCFFVQDTIS